MKAAPYTIWTEDGNSKAPKKRFTAASTGSLSMKRPTKRSRSNISDENDELYEDDLSDQSVMLDIMKKMRDECTCSRSKQKKHSCCYVKNWELTSSTLVSCRQIFNGLDKDEVRSRQHEIMRATEPQVVCTQSRNKKVKLKYNYVVNGKAVCHNTFLTLYNISEHQFRVFAERVRSKGSIFVNTEKVVKWTDDYVHDISFNEMTNCYEDNLQTEAGNDNILNIVLSIILCLNFIFC